ncbi:MAG: hypothetical protein ACQEXX_26075 [Bacillota bacterium]
MKKMFLYKFMLMACALLIASAAILPVSAVDAADKKWINQVWSQYETYNKKTVDAYKAYQERIDKDFKQFNDSSNAVLDALESKVLSDQKVWIEKLEADYEQLDQLYGNNREMADDLKRYRNYINPANFNSPMWKYSIAANRTHFNSTLWKLDKALNDAHFDSYMWNYSKTINPAHFNSAAWKMKNNVSDTSFDSNMWHLRKLSSDSSFDSTMWKYSKGKLSKTQAKKQYDKLFKELTTALAKYNTARKKDITDMVNSTKKKVNELHHQTIQALESQREKTLKEISELRTKITGEGLQWEPLLVTP